MAAVLVLGGGFGDYTDLSWTASDIYWVLFTTKEKSCSERNGSV